MEFLAFLEKNWVLALAFVLSGAMLVWPLVTRRLSTITEIGTAEVTRLMNKEDPVLLDVREAKEYDGRRLPNAIHIPLSQLKDRAGELAKSAARPVVVYCDRGQRAKSAAGALKRAGFERIYVLAGGQKAWKDASLPMQKD